MANFNGILKEISGKRFKSPADQVRDEKIKKLSEFTGRNVITYYSGFLTSDDNPGVSINDNDMAGFMTAIHGLDKNKGLDLIIHTPGGEVAATESIGNYLRSVFGNNVRVIVPQLAMSGGTMLACIGKEIVMGKHSSIGPVDPQLGGVPAYSVIRQFEEAKKEIMTKPESIPYWRALLDKFPPIFISQCYMAVELSTEVLKNWLEAGGMFDNVSKNEKRKKIKKIMDFLNENKHTKMHNRHINIDKAKEIGLSVANLEDDNELQDAVLSIHHAYMYTFQSSNAVKIIENDKGHSYIITETAQ